MQVERAAMCFGIGESLFIARPVIYAGLLYYFHRQSDIRNGGAGGNMKRRAYWTPWLVSLFVDVASLSLLNIGNKYARGSVAAGHPCPDRCERILQSNIYPPSLAVRYTCSFLSRDALLLLDA